VRSPRGPAAVSEDEGPTATGSNTGKAVPRMNREPEDLPERTPTLNSPGMGEWNQRNFIYGKPAHFNRCAGFLYFSAMRSLLPVGTKREMKE